MPAFTTAGWAKTTNIYEVNLRQYTAEGTINAFAKSLQRLRNMNVETLWFMPLQPIGRLNRKGVLGSYYSISDYTAINPEFGTTEDFKNLVRAAKELGFKIIIDWVANHTAWDHVWTRTHPEFYSKDEQGNFKSPYDWSDVIHLNYDNPELYDAMIAAMQYWVEEFGIDGFRCDMAHLVRLDFWVRARTSLDKIKPLFWLAETEDIIYHEAFDASYTWEWMHKTEDFVKGHSNLHSLFDQLLQYDREFPADAIRLYFTSNHDENSHNGTEFEKYGDAYEPLAVFSCTWNGIPLLYSGQEFPNRKRLRFFEKDTIEWDGNYGYEKFYKTLFSLRRTNAALRCADNQVRTYKLENSAPGNVFSYLRVNAADAVLIIINMSQDVLQVRLLTDLVVSQYENVFDGKELTINSETIFCLQGWGYLVYQKINPA